MIRLMRIGAGMCRGIPLTRSIISNVSGLVHLSKTKWRTKTDTRIDDVEAVEGLPVGVQVVGGKFGEEKSIAVAKVIEALLK